MIRHATLADMPELMRMAEAFLASSAFGSVVSFDADRMQRLMETLITHPDMDILVPETLDGMLAVRTTVHDMSGEVFAGEVFWWVDTAKRGIAGWRLKQSAERWARNRGATRMQMSAPNERVGDMLTRDGFQRVEITYMKELR